MWRKRAKLRRARERGTAAAGSAAVSAARKIVKAWRRSPSTIFPGSCSISWPPSFTVSWVGPEVKAGQRECSRCTLLRCEEEAKIETTSGTASCLGCDPGAYLHVGGIPRPGLPGQHGGSGDGFEWRPRPIGGSPAASHRVFTRTPDQKRQPRRVSLQDRKSTRLNSSHL